MKCSNCGATVEEGKLFCPNCGQELQWVPDYNSMGNYMDQERLKKEKEEKERAAAIKKRNAAAAIERRRKKKRRNITLLATAIVIMVVAIAAILLRLHTSNKNYNDFDYQMRMADTAFSNHKYEESYEYVERAVSLDDSSADARLLMAQILVKLEKNAQAEKTLLDLIAQDPDNVTAYGQLIKLYAADEKTDEIKTLLDGCENEDVLDKYSGYISDPPVFSLQGTEYSEAQSLQLLSKSEGASIYYTTDGTDPTKDSTLYNGPITLEEGSTTVKAIVINGKGISSDITEKTYMITYEAPDPPQISPSSGKFTTDMDTSIYIIVPEGCKAYYSFDEKPTLQSDLYDEDEPVKMLKGTHTFYAILVDEHNKISAPGSAQYTLTNPD